VTAVASGFGKRAELNRELAPIMRCYLSFAIRPADSKIATATPANTDLKIRENGQQLYRTVFYYDDEKNEKFTTDFSFL
jgi:hypothetical protein